MALSDISELPETCVVVLSVRASAGAATASFLTSSEREEEVGRLQLAAGSSPVKERQSFLLTKRARLGASAVTLQDHCGRFVGPNHIDAGGPAEADRWVARRYRTAGAHGGVPEAGWEMLSVAVDSRRAADGLADTLAITLLQRGGRSLLGHRAWSLALAAPPVLNLRALRTEGGLAAAAAAPRFDSLGPAARQLVRQVLRAQRDVGAFLVVGHGLSRDLFAACQMAAGSYSWRPNEHAEGSSERDAAFKLNLGLVADQRDRAPPTRRATATMSWSAWAAAWARTSGRRWPSSTSTRQRCSRTGCCTYWRWLPSLRTAGPAYGGGRGTMASGSARSARSSTTLAPCVTLPQRATLTQRGSQCSTKIARGAYRS